jgi:L-histidine N-alpha-methyltransferase
LLEPGDLFLLGTDLVKEPERLVAAYDDDAGVTAEFNRNLLRRLDRELDADFDADSFDHIARWNQQARWIEMRLRSTRDQIVSIGALAMEVHLDAGEEILTEISAKFTPEGVVDELWDAGMSVFHSWTDEAGDFQLSLAGLRL